MSPEMLAYLLNLIRKVSGQILNPVAQVLPPDGNLGLGTASPDFSTAPNAELSYNGLNTATIRRAGKYRVSYNVDVNLAAAVGINTVQLQVRGPIGAVPGSTANLAVPAPAAGNIIHVAQSFEVDATAAGLALTLNVPVNTNAANTFTNLVFEVTQIQSIA